MTHKHYVYIYCDPRKKGVFNYPGIDYTFNYEPFYVGEGKGYRYRRHLTNYEIEWNYNKIKNGKIKKIIEDGFDLLKYIVFYKENLTKEDAGELEKKIIKKLGRINCGNGILANLTDGGEGWSGAVSPFKGKTYEDIYGKEKSDKLKEIKRKQLKGNTYGSKTKGRKFSIQQKIKLSKAKSWKIKQLDLNLKLIKTWDSSIDAAEFLKISVSGIHNTVNDKMPAKTAGGFKWEFINRKNIKYNG